MFNLLPDNLKQEIKSEYKMRRISVALVLLIIIQISVFFFLFPSWILSNTKETSIVIQLEKTDETSLSSDSSKIRDKIKSINNELNLLSTALVYPRFSPIVDHILSQRNQSISLDSFSLNNGKTSVLTIRGISSTREALVSFVDSLKASSQFSSVDLPVSNLAKSKNIDFSITLNISN